MDKNNENLGDPYDYLKEFHDINSPLSWWNNPGMLFAPPEYNYKPPRTYNWKLYSPRREICMTYYYREFEKLGIKNFDLYYDDGDDDWPSSEPSVYLTSTKLKVYFFYPQRISLNMRKGLPLLHEDYMKFENRCFHVGFKLYYLSSEKKRDERRKKARESIDYHLVKIRDGIFEKELIERYKKNHHNLISRLYKNKSETMQVVLDSMSGKERAKTIKKINRKAKREIKSIYRWNKSEKKYLKLLSFLDYLGLDKKEFDDYYKCLFK